MAGQEDIQQHKSVCESLNGEKDASQVEAGVLRAVVSLAAGEDAPGAAVEPDTKAEPETAIAELGAEEVSERVEAAEDKPPSTGGRQRSPAAAGDRESNRNTDDDQAGNAYERLRDSNSHAVNASCAVMHDTNQAGNSSEQMQQGNNQPGNRNERVEDSSNQVGNSNEGVMDDSNQAGNSSEEMRKGSEEHENSVQGVEGVSNQMGSKAEALRICSNQAGNSDGGVQGGSNQAGNVQEGMRENRNQPINSKDRVQSANEGAHNSKERERASSNHTGACTNQATGDLFDMPGPSTFSAMAVCTQPATLKAAVSAPVMTHQALPSQKQCQYPECSCFAESQGPYAGKFCKQHSPKSNDGSSSVSAAANSLHSLQQSPLAAFPRPSKSPIIDPLQATPSNVSHLAASSGLFNKTLQNLIHTSPAPYQSTNPLLRTTRLPSSSTQASIHSRLTRPKSTFDPAAAAAAEPSTGRRTLQLPPSAAPSYNIFKVPPPSSIINPALAPMQPISASTAAMRVSLMMQPVSIGPSSSVPPLQSGTAAAMPAMQPKVLEPAVCPHGVRSDACFQCSTITCIHGIQTYRCGDCGYSRPRCRHGLERSKCDDCASQITCQHNRNRYNCPACRPVVTCPHGRYRSCQRCGGVAKCEHGKSLLECPLCDALTKCVHGRRAHICKLCREAECVHGVKGPACAECVMNKQMLQRKKQARCSHLLPLQDCPICSQPDDLSHVASPPGSAADGTALSADKSPSNAARADEAAAGGSDKSGCMTGAGDVAGQQGHQEEGTLMSNADVDVGNNHVTIDLSGTMDVQLVPNVIDVDLSSDDEIVVSVLEPADGGSDDTTEADDENHRAAKRAKHDTEGDGLHAAPGDSSVGDTAPTLHALTPGVARPNYDGLLAAAGVNRDTATPGLKQPSTAQFGARPPQPLSTAQSSSSHSLDPALAPLNSNKPTIQSSTGPKLSLPTLPSVLTSSTSTPATIVPSSASLPIVPTLAPSNALNTPQTTQQQGPSTSVSSNTATRPVAALCVHAKVRQLCPLCRGRADSCVHGRNKNDCADCGAAPLCEHGKRRLVCTDCGASRICEHGQQRNECGQCQDGNICVHDRERNRCRTCASSSTCMHGVVKSECRTCGGGSVCEHGKRRSRCKFCGGTAICEHMRERRTCKQCGGTYVCPHGKIKSKCLPCGGKSVCEHGRERSKCKQCGGNSICFHGKERSKCRVCAPHSFCVHDKLRHKCKDCKGLVTARAKRVTSKERQQQNDVLNGSIIGSLVIPGFFPKKMQPSHFSEAHVPLPAPPPVQPPVKPPAPKAGGGTGAKRGRPKKNKSLDATPTTAPAAPAPSSIPSDQGAVHETGRIAGFKAIQPGAAAASLAPPAPITRQVTTSSYLCPHKQPPSTCLACNSTAQMYCVHGQHAGGCLQCHAAERQAQLMPKLVVTNLQRSAQAPGSSIVGAGSRYDLDLGDDLDGMMTGFGVVGPMAMAAINSHNTSALHFSVSERNTQHRTGQNSYYGA